MPSRAVRSIAAAVIAALCGGVAIVGSVAPWFRFSFLGASVNINGTSQYLSGRWALGCAVVGFLAAVGAGVLHRRRAPLACGVVAVLAGLGGLAVMRHQGRHLTNAKALLNANESIRLFNKYFAAHTVTTWGFWLDVWAFIALMIAGVLVVIASVGRSEQPQRAAVDRDDAPREV
jgi:hypothetical protein